MHSICDSAFLSFTMGSILIAITAIAAWSLLSWGVYTDYQSTLPYCLEDEEQGQCRPCPDHAKCIRREIQCDERYKFQDGQCIPMHIEDTEQHGGLVKDTAHYKRMYLITVEGVATFVASGLLLWQLRPSHVVEKPE